jgi:4'-phosphopantetheinyl transferase
MPLHFNLSHSHNLALCGVARSAIGVDLEQLRPLDNALNLAQRFFAPAESARLEQLTPGELASGFFRHWVCKEAYVKAIGQGLAHQLDQVQISFQSQAQLILPAASDIEQPSEQPNTEQLNNLAKTWTLRELTPQAQTVAAVVTQTLPTSWHFWQGHWNFVE